MKTLACLAAAVALSACGQEHAAPPPLDRPSGLASTVVTGHPAVGLAVERRDAVELVGLDGRVHTRIPNVKLGYVREQERVVLRERGGVQWRFRPADGRFTRLPRPPAARPRAGCKLGSRRGDLRLFLCAPPSRVEGIFPSAKTIELRRGGSRRLLAHPPFPAPTPNIGPIGHWESAALSPDGRTVLAQWSAECEIPIAFVLPVRGGTPRPVAGTLKEHPESIALGWTPAGRAVVFLPRLACGSAYEGPGVYLVSPQGDVLRPIVKGRDIRGAALWTSGEG